MICPDLYTVEATLKNALKPDAVQDEDTPWRFAEALAAAGLDDPCVSLGLQRGDVSFTAQVTAFDAVDGTESVTRAVVTAASATGLFDRYPGLSVMKVYPCEMEEAVVDAEALVA